MQSREVKMLILVLLIHTGLLAWSVGRHSPTIDEVGHLSAGLSHWRLNRFDLYNVNPPLVRTVATLPLHLMNVPIDFSGYQVLPRHRGEFGIGARWISAHPDFFLRGFTVARWACIPFSLLGAVTCFFWARDLYGSRAGWMALCLWCFCPNILAHGSLMTPDAGATAVGVAACYVFRKWLIHQSTGWAAGAGLMLGLTLLTKFTWLFLLGLWPLCWLVVRLKGAKSRWRDGLGHLGLIMLSAFWVLNNGYLFEDSFQRLGDFQFFSQSLSARDPGTAASEGGNRFRGTLLEHLPAPVPRNFLQGIDHIKFEYERGYQSYLRGVKRHGGWWYYYLYAMLVKLPVGTLLLIGIAAGLNLRNHRRHRDPRDSTEVKDEKAAEDTASKSPEFSVVPPVTAVPPVAVVRSVTAVTTVVHPALSWFETAYLLAPAVGILWLVSAQTGFNHHLRYVLPAFPFLFIFAGRTALPAEERGRVVRALPIACVAWMIISSLSVYPHSLSYFNELSGGSINGWKHLDNSNIDWGQDMILVKEWVEEHPEATPLFVHPSGYVSAEQMGIRTAATKAFPRTSGTQGDKARRELAPGWYIVGLTRLVDPRNQWHELLHREPDGYIGYSMRIYHVKPPDDDVIPDPDIRR